MLTVEQKENLRKELLQKRLSLLPEKVTTLSRDIEKKVMELLYWKQAENVGLYSNVKNEVETSLLFAKSLEEGKRVFFPRVEQGLGFYEVLGPEDLEKGAWGIMEPKHTCDPVLAEDGLGVVIVPALAFSEQGFRLGYGKGFYDRVLQNFKGVSIGITYDFMLLEDLPHEPHDRAVNYVVTEKRVIEIK